MRIVPDHAPTRLVAAVLLVAALLVSGGAVADDSATKPDAAAMRIYRDPATGAFTAPPKATAPPVASRALEAPAAALVETPGTSAAGGITLDLRGGFQSAISATADATGHVTTDCVEQPVAGTP